MQNKIDQSVDILVAHNSNEGIMFTDPRTEGDDTFRAYFANLLPDLSSEKLDIMATEIYPLDFSGTQPYKNHIERLVLAVGDCLFDCYAFGMNLAYENRTRGYLFDICPGVHAQDVSYSLHDGEETDYFGRPIDFLAAGAMKSWIVDFTLMGGRHGSAARQLPIFGSTARILHVGKQDATESNFTVVKDPAANPRCQFWLDGVFA